MSDHRDKTVSAEGAKGRDKKPVWDGNRLPLSELNLATGKTRGPLKRFLQKLNLFLAGMYTGEGCAGTPHSERSSNEHRRKPAAKDDTLP